MKRSLKKVNLVPLPGFMSKDRILEVVRDCIRAYPKDQKEALCRAIVIESIKWSCYSSMEAVGLMWTLANQFLQDREDEHR